MNLSIEETGDFNLSVNLNTDFDFFENVDFSESIELKFKCEKYPLDNKIVFRSRHILYLLIDRMILMIF